MSWPLAYPSPTMPVTDPYFRFPLGALSWGGSAIQALAAIIDYSVVSAGIGLPAVQKAHNAAARSASERSLPASHERCSAR